MYNFQILDFEKMNPSEVEVFIELQKPLLKSAPKPLDLFAPANRKLFAIGVKFGSSPIALLLARMYYQEKIGEIINLFVSTPHRHKKVASMMIELLKEKSLANEFKQIGIVYPSFQPETPQIEQFLKINGFCEKKFILAEFQFDSSLFNPPWLRQNFIWPKDYSVFPWYQLRQEEKNLINKKYEQGSIPYDVYPFIESNYFEPCNSLGLRYKNELIGWIINERCGTDTINYKNIYIDYDFQWKGCSILLLIESIKIHKIKSIKTGIFQINMINCSLSWLHFIRKRLAPYAEFIYEYSSQSLFSKYYK